jgi:hypothetical protein
MAYTEFMLTLIFLIIAVICFFLATGNVFMDRVNLMALGLAFWALSEVLKLHGSA